MYTYPLDVEDTKNLIRDLRDGKITYEEYLGIIEGDFNYLDNPNSGKCGSCVDYEERFD